MRSIACWVMLAAITSACHKPEDYLLSQLRPGRFILSTRAGREHRVGNHDERNKTLGITANRQCEFDPRRIDACADCRSLGQSNDDFERIRIRKNDI